jgi:uncharacterized protein
MGNAQSRVRDNRICMPNRLAREKSPYLLQHQNNPVEWYAWGDEAFEAARTQEKPVFLSVGYSTCHWCHVMEHESFENEQIAALLNRHFVSIKVDREERPDVDRTYMAYVQTATGAGGWPMSVWLTPDGRPFLGGTYFPPENRYGRPGFPAVLERIAHAWATERERIVEASEQVAADLAREAEVGTPSSDITADALDSGFHVCRRLFDSRLGGFGQAPKFPRPAILDFLLRYHARTKNAEALEMVVTTLHAMSRGGMNDQLGGGFHRYSVDEYWFVPHFEKMLYDQAQLARALTETYVVTRDDAFAAEARRVLDYVMRDMSNPEGAFYSAEDADSVIDPAEPMKKGEGAFYVWSPAEIRSALGEEAARIFMYRYGAEEHGNVQNDPHAEFEGRNILFSAYSPEATAHHFDLPLSEVAQSLAASERRLLELRGDRVRPHLDDKVLTAWNGLMIGAFAVAGAALGSDTYLGAARGAASFIRKTMWNAETRTLLRRYRDGEAAIYGFLDDYAFLINGLLDLYQGDFDPGHLDFAIALAERMRELFEDKERGGFFTTAIENADPRALLRMKDDYDGAEPAGNSVAAIALLRIERLTGLPALGDAARNTLRAFGARLRAQPFAMPEMLCAVDLALSPPHQVVIAGLRDDVATAALIDEVRKHFLPDTAILLVDEVSRESIARWNETAREWKPINGQPAAFVCENFVCQLPVMEPGKLAELLVAGQYQNPSTPKPSY